MITALLFAASAVILIVAAELFTNAVEWAGYRLRLGSGATGSLLAAIGTSLPETIVPVVALATRSPSADSVATGAVLGAPFLLLTLGAAFTGVAVLLRRGRRELVLDRRQPRRDLGVFLAGFSLALLCILLPFPLRVTAGTLLLMGYIAYVVRTLRSSVPDEEMPEPLHIVRWIVREEPHGVLIALQLVIAVGLLVLGSQLFVGALDSVAAALSISPLVLALIVAPMATELPESLNGVLWVRSGDDGLAFGNIAGSSAFQATVLASIGLVFTSWHPGVDGLIGALLALLSATFLLAVLWRGRARGFVLALAGIPWLGYVVAQLVTGGHLAR
ncbi:MAG: sodium:calcium antiporter [Candidatus Dormibacteraeota bacterium]|nr:sodium:calcium antiporter [Candidatus Dormibacteraeota bacterium]